AQMREVAPGIYEGAFDLPMSGAWPLTIRIEKAGLGEVTASFALATGRPGLELSSGATRVTGEATTSDRDTQSGMLSASPYRIGAEVEPETPHVGENRLTIVLANADGEPLSNAKIHAVAEMPAMGSMP